MNITFPSNAGIFYTLINDVANFDIIPTDTIKEMLFNFTDAPENDENFKQMGYESKNIIDNLGSMIVYLAAFFALAIIALALRLLKNYSKM